MASGATEIPAPAAIKQVVRYLYDRSRSLPGGWVSVADLRGALGIDLETVRARVPRAPRSPARRAHGRVSHPTRRPIASRLFG